MSKEFPTNMKRVMALIGHGGCGKTSLGDAMIYLAGAVERQGKVDEKTSVLDMEPEEIETKHTIQPAIIDFEWNHHKVAMVDTPGYSAYIHEAENVLHAVGGAVLVVSAVDGVRVQTEQITTFAKTLKVPMLVFINAMDKERANFQQTLDQIEHDLGINPVALALPIGADLEYKGVVDVLNRKAYLADPANPKAVTATAVPADLADEVESMRESLVERLVEADDEVMERYLETMEASDQDLATCLRKGVLNGVFTPVFCGSALKCSGLTQLMDGVVNLLPSPLEERPRAAYNPNNGEERTITFENADTDPFRAIVFKTMTDPYSGRISVFRIFSGTVKTDAAVRVFGGLNKSDKEKVGKLISFKGKKQENPDIAMPGDIVALAKLKETSTRDTLSTEDIYFPWTQGSIPVLSYCVTPKVKGEDEKLGMALNKILEEDTGLTMKREPQTKELIVSGMGQQHFDLMFQRMKRMYNVEALTRTPKIPYRETIKSEVSGIEGKLKKQSGGRGQFGDCWINIRAQARGATDPLKFNNNVVGGVIPGQFIPAVEKGIREAMDKGPLSGSPVQDIEVDLYDGKYHPVDSSEYAFKVAGAQAFKAAFMKAEPVLLEPIMRLVITVPEENMGDIMGDINGRRGRVLGMDAKGRYQEIRAEVPLSEIQMYAPTVKSLTSDRGTFVMTFDRYEEVPFQLAEKIIEELRKDLVETE